MSAAVSVCLVLGTAIFLLAVVGLLRLPDVYLRMHASSKGSTLGIALILLAVSIHYSTFSVILRAVMIVVFLYVTVPIATHIIAKAAYFSGISPWHGAAAEDDMVEDELKDSGTN
jgi:multicomponent Na+:H+ antiporter subunit G